MSERQKAIDSPCPDCNAPAGVPCGEGYLTNKFLEDRAKRRAHDPGVLVIERNADGTWPAWVLTGLGWELDDTHDLSAVMEGVWRERPRYRADLPAVEEA